LSLAETPSNGNAFDCQVNSGIEKKQLGLMDFNKGRSQGRENCPVSRAEQSIGVAIVSIPKLRVEDRGWKLPRLRRSGASNDGKSPRYLTTKLNRCQ